MQITQILPCLCDSVLCLNRLVSPSLTLVIHSLLSISTMSTVWTPCYYIQTWKEIQYILFSLNDLTVHGATFYSWKLQYQATNVNDLLAWNRKPVFKIWDLVFDCSGWSWVRHLLDCFFMSMLGKWNLNNTSEKHGITCLPVVPSRVIQRHENHRKVEASGSQVWKHLQSQPGINGEF